MTLQPWPLVRDELLVHYKVFAVHKTHRRSPRTGADIGFFLIDTPDWVNVIAFTTAVAEKIGGNVADALPILDAALVALSEKFDRVRLAPATLRVSRDEIDAAIASARATFTAMQEWLCKKEQIAA